MKNIFERMKAGEIISPADKEYSELYLDPIECNDKVDDTNFSASEKAILESVVKHICCYSGKVLEKFTRSETPWLSARGNLLETEPSDRIIDKDDIGKYFDGVKEKYNMINPNDIKAYTQTMFQQI